MKMKWIGVEIKRMRTCWQTHTHHLKIPDTSRPEVWALFFFVFKQPVAHWIRGSCLFFLRKLAEETKKGFREPSLQQSPRIDTGEREELGLSHKYRTNHWNSGVVAEVLVGPIPPLVPRRGDGHLSFIRTDVYVCSMFSSETLTNGKERLLESQVLKSFSCFLYL